MTLRAHLLPGQRSLDIAEFPAAARDPDCPGEHLPIGQHLPLHRSTYWPAHCPQRPHKARRQIELLLGSL